MTMDVVLSALSAGDDAAAEAALAPLLAAQPNDPAILRLMASLLVRQNRPREALPIVQRYANAEPSADSLTFLSDLHYRLNAFTDYEITLARLIRMNAATSVQLRQLAKVKMVAGKIEEAQEVLRQALIRAPDDVDVMGAYGDSVAGTPARAAAAFEAMLSGVANTPDRTSFLIKRITLHQARANRIRDGLDPDVAASWQEVCAWPDQPGLARLHQALLAEITNGAARGGAYLDLACVALAHQKWDFAEVALAHMRRGMRDPVADCATFGSVIHGQLEQLSDEALLAGLAPVRHVFRLSPQSPATMFLASDYGYFKRFTVPYVRSLEDAGVRADVQIHLLDGDTAQWAAAAAELAFARTVHIGMSAEASGALAQGILKARVYYHAVRFIRLYQEVKRTGRATWLLDADVNFVGTPLPTFKAFKDFDVALRGNPTWFEPTWKFAAACVGIAPSALGLEYARRVAAYIAYWRSNDRWTWGVDQIALYACYARMCELGRQPATQFLGRDVFASPGDAGGVFQFPGGLRKYASARQES